MSVGSNPIAVDLTTAQEKFEKVKKQVCVCGNGLELRPTEFGLGLFATKFFAKGDAITLYGGQLIDIKTAKKRLEENQDSHIRRHIVRRYCFDGSILPDGTRIENAAVQLVGLPVGAFCNDSSDEKQINAKFNYIDSAENEKSFAAFERGFDYNPSPDQRLTYVEAIRDINADDQICCSYGLQYWERSAEKKNALKEQTKTKKRPANL